MNAIDLSSLILKSGSHEARESGVCAMEAVAWLASEPHSDRPVCACPVISAYVRTLNDRMPDDQRQRLVAYLPRLIGTNNPAKAQARAELLAWAAIRQFAPPTLRAAGLTEHADKLANFEGTFDAAYAVAVHAARTANVDNDAVAYAANAAYAVAADPAATAAYAAANAAYAAAAASVWDAALNVLDVMLTPCT